jgi:hypothetical protein
VEDRWFHTQLEAAVDHHRFAMNYLYAPQKSQPVELLFGHFLLYFLRPTQRLLR